MSSTAKSFDRSAIMREAVAFAREMIRREREWHFSRYAAQIRHGGKVPALRLPSWREAMREGLRHAWKEARRGNLQPPAEAAAVSLEILTIQAAERISRPDAFALAALQSRAAQLAACSAFAA